MVSVLFLSAIIYAGLVIFSDPVALLFNRDRDPVLQEIAVKGIKLYFMAVPFTGCNIVLSSYFASMEKSGPAQMISLLRGMVLIIPVVYTMASLWKLSGVWLSFLVTEMLTLAAGFVLLKKNVI